MSTKSFLESLMASGRDLVSKGTDFAKRKVDLPESEEKREAMLSGLGKGAVGGGLLALLVGTKAGRRLAGPLVKYGSLAALGAVGYTTYKKWQAENSPEEVGGLPMAELADDAAESRSMVLLRAMIAAAKADGHVDDNERSAIKQQIDTLDLDDKLAESINSEIESPLDPKKVAALADSREAAVEIYLVSLAVIDVDNYQERLYLQELAQDLKLPADLVTKLEEEALA